MAAHLSTQNSDAIAEHVVSSSPQTNNDRESQRSPSRQQQSSSLLLTQLPTEILHSIVGLLRNRDIKKLRLSCKFFAHVAVLRLHRVFLSANPLNIQVFRAIADHEGYRHGVTELIYDDARLPRSSFEVIASRWPFYHTNAQAYWSSAPMGDEEWFQIEYWRNIEHFKFKFERSQHCSPRHRAEKQQALAQMPFEACWQYYQDLVRQQDEVIASNADMEALLYGLERFPSLRTVTVTPAAHGYLFFPFYETPMIRAFPSGFYYHVPRGWPPRAKPDVRDGERLIGEPASWVGEDESLLEKIRSPWRGCLLVFRALAQVRNHHVSEFLIDANQIESGLSCRMFDEPCDAYADLVSVLGRPGMRRFHISLLVDDQWGNEWASFRSGLLRKALAKCVAMEDFALTTDMYYCEDDGDTFPLATVIPIDCWPQLQQLKLWNLLVKKAELISFLAQLPQTLRSLELSLLRFNDEPGENYCELLSDMRSTLHWKQRRIQPGIKIALIEIGRGQDDQTIVIWLEKEVEEYLYGQGDNPFEGLDRDEIPENIGIMRDALDPDFKLLRRR